MSRPRRLNSAELAVAYELKAHGCEIDLIAENLGVDGDYLDRRLREVERHGMTYTRPAGRQIGGE